MVYPTKAHIRQFTGLTVAAALVGTLGYVGTRASLERQTTAGARTQDISLEARSAQVTAAPSAQRLGRFMNGVASGAPAAATGLVQESTIASTAYDQLLAGPASFTSNNVSRGSGGGFGNFGNSGIQTRVHSAGGTGFSSGGYGMNGVGAWGGVSGSVRPLGAGGNSPSTSPALKFRTAAAGATTKSQRNGNGSGGGSTATAAGVSSAAVVAGASGVAPTLLADASGALSNGFSAGANAVAGASGSVPPVGGGEVASAGPAPAATPEPISLLLVGTGLAGLFGMRRYII